MKYIGILLNNNVFRGIPYGKTRYENLSFYEEAAKLHGLTPCYFRLKDIKPDMKEVTAYVKGNSAKYKKKSIPMPKVIHNRGMYFARKHKNQLESLVEQGFIVFNQWNRYRKSNVHRILIKYDELIENLPETRKATEDNIKQMLSRYSNLILKPDNGSLGYGVMKMEKQGNENLLIILKSKEKDSLKIPFTEKIPKELKNIISSNNYILQEYIPLATYKGNPFDLRVSCQKNHSGQWQVTGIVGKVARDDSFITNVAGGGTSYQLGILLQDTMLDEKTVINGIEQVSLRIVKVLEEHLPGLADVGLDMGITAEGIIKFIECNGRDLRVTFRNANMDDTWKNTHSTPIGYGKFLLDRR
ncbi:glutathione synthase/RimK-type ligase-like ATP-grasp enzyme [Desulfitispora alkaliphila]|uniref:YheC/YheD family endospore coat-associated protein n=1 Tax=Desulfitispora alkaliphila TaxID=622674 RepID=UPI003D1AB24E